MVCLHCGVVQERVFDSHLEKRLFGEAGDEARKRADVGEEDEELATGMSAAPYKPTGAVDLAPGVMAISKGAPSRRLAASLSAKNKATVEAEEKLAHYCESMRLTGSLRETCRGLYRDLCNARKEKSHSARGCRTDAVLAAVVYLGCKRDGHARTFREISRETGVSQQDIRTGYRLLVRTLPQELTHAERTNPAGLVSRICDTLNLPFAISRRAEDLARKAEQYVEGRQPGSVAAAAVYIVLRNAPQGDQRTDMQIADAANVTPSTVRIVADTILKHLDEINGTIVPSAAAAAAATAIATAEPS